MIPDEPVRGRTPPPWFCALSGLERLRAISQGLLPATPLGRLLGVRTTHVVPGAVTLTMPAAESSLGANGQLVVTPFLQSALEGACTTALSAGEVAAPLFFAINPFRPARAHPGNLLARARILNSSRFFVFAEAQLEDPEGRHIAHGTLQAAIRRVESSPPPPPDPLPLVEEPVYETPDPYLRSFPRDLGAAPFEQEDGLSILRRFMAGVLAGTMTEALNEMYGLKPEEVNEGHVIASMPASEWFCSLDRKVSSAAIAGFGELASWMSAVTLSQPGTSAVGLDTHFRFLRPAIADGRRLLAEARISEIAPGVLQSESTIRDADGELIAKQSGATVRLDASQRAQRRQREPERILATLLFTDIVDSTAHAERLGDAGWRALLEEQRTAVRRELGRHKGAEVDTAGDGFFARFATPAGAMAAARAIRSATQKLGIEIRAGIHTGECEVDGNKLVGMAVHIAARIQSKAEPGEILVSSTVKDLAGGAGLRFGERGEHTLKGVPDPWRLYTVLD